MPSIAAVRNPKPDMLIDGVTGIAIEPRAPQQLADAIERLARDPAGARCLGEAAQRMAIDNFDAQRNAARLLDLYRRVLAS